MLKHEDSETLNFDAYIKSEDSEVLQEEEDSQNELIKVKDEGPVKNKRETKA